MSDAEKITLQKYIDKHGTTKIASALGCSRNSVWLWSKLEVAPTFSYAVALIKLSRGKLDFEAIYRPYYK